MSDIKRKLLERIEALYEAGYEHALEGKPPQRGRTGFREQIAAHLANTPARAD